MLFRMAEKLKIDSELYKTCKLCKSVCIRDNIDVDETAFEFLIRKLMLITCNLCILKLYYLKL